MEENNVSKDLNNEEKENLENVYNEESTKKEEVAKEEKTEETSAKEVIASVEDITEIEVEKVITEDFSSLTKEELVEKVKDINKEEDLISQRTKVEVIKAAFYKISKAEYEEKKSKFFVDNPDAESEDYSPLPDILYEEFKDLLTSFKVRKDKQIKDEENKRLNNLNAKREILEELQHMIRGEETLNRTFNEFQKLQEKWRSIGEVPITESKKLWNDYHFHVNNFYNWVKLNKEARDIDLKKNLEKKIELCEKVEALILEKSINKSFEKLQEYHEIWREIGPVEEEKSDDVWNRFSSATKIIHKKRQDHFDKIHEEQKANFVKKTEICEKAEAVIYTDAKDLKDWNKISDKVNELETSWKKIGFAPKKVNNQVYRRFRNALKGFYDARNQFYKQEREKQKHNLNLKKDLISQAEALKDSTDWKETANKLKRLQSEWKNIGLVPAKVSQKLWSSFRAACDTFFNNMQESYKEQEKGFEENLKNKKELIKEIEKYKPEEKEADTLKALQEFQRKWIELGMVPIKERDKINKKYKKAVDSIFESLNIESGKISELKYKSKIENLTQGKNPKGGIIKEKEDIRHKISKLESELVTLENNIGFFSNSKNAEVMINEIQSKIDKIKEKIAVNKKKLRMIDKASKEL